MAYLQARSGIARSGVTYAGWTPRNIRAYLAGADATANLLLEGWTLAMREDPSATFSFRTKSIAPVPGQDVRLTYATPNDYLFGGTIQQVEAAPEAPDSDALMWHCTAGGYQWLIDRYDRVLAQYDNVGVGTMVADILYRFTDGGFRVGYCPSSLGNLTMEFTWEGVWAALTRIAQAVGAILELTPNRIVNLYTTYPEAALATVTGADVVQGSVAYRKDITQVRTRVVVRGKSTSVQAAVAAGASNILVDDASAFDASGGLAISGRNLITYIQASPIIGGGWELLGVSGVVHEIAAGDSIALVAESDDGAAQTALATALGGSYRDTVVADGPEVYLRLNDTAGTTADDEINAHDGTYNGSPTKSQTGLISTGTSVLFDGSDDFITVPDHADLDITTNLTMEAWVHADAYDVTFPRILAKGSGSGNGYQLLVDRDIVGGPKLAVQLQGVTPASFTSTGQVPLATTTHIVVTYDGSNVRIYLNGALDSTTPATGSITTNATALFIGQRGDGTARWHGRLDEVAVYSVVLSGPQIAEHYGLRTTQSLSGQATHVLQDDSLTHAEATARAAADLAVFSAELEELKFTYKVPQRYIRVGRTVSVDFSDPFVLARDFTMRGITITPRGELGADDYNVQQQIEGSGFTRTLQDLLRQLPG